VRFLDTLGLDATHSVLVCEQNHTNHIRQITTENMGHWLFDQTSQLPNTDGMVTDIPGINLVIYTADCMPVSFYDPVKKVIAVAHSGWRGTVAWISKNILDCMVNTYGSDIWDIHVSIWPSIGPCCYEVTNPEQIAIFDKKYNNIHIHWDTKSVDIWDSIEQDMMNSGIQKNHFENQKVCTACQNSIYASHRKDNPNTTANLTVISMKQ
jgi:YfiH family protein